jgi:hypothetical protein
MTKYDIIFEQLQSKVNSGELTMEDAQILNDVAFEKYGEDDTEYEEVTESSNEDECVTYEEYLEAMEEELFGEATRLAKEIHKKSLAADKNIAATGSMFDKNRKEFEALKDDDNWDTHNKHHDKTLKLIDASTRMIEDKEQLDAHDSIARGQEIARQRAEMDRTNYKFKPLQARRDKKEFKKSLDDASDLKKKQQALKGNNVLQSMQ